MTSFFPDLNVWLALTDAAHVHHRSAGRWLEDVASGSRLLFSWYTQVGLMRLLTNQAVMGEQTCTVAQAWLHYDRWLADPRVQFHAEPRTLDAGFRDVTASFAAQPASKSVGDCYLLAHARECDATLVTFDRALAALAKKHGCDVAIPR